MKNKVTSFLHTFFTENIGYKVAALLIGIVVWALLSNTEDPIQTKDVYVPVTYLYEEKLLNQESLCVLNAPSTIRITVQARNSKLSKIKPELFSCTADLMSHSGGDLTAQLVHAEVIQNSGFDIVVDWSYYKSDPNVTVALDEYITKSFYVGLRTEKSLPAGLFFGGSQDFEPGIVTVSGPKTKFGNLASVKASVDLEELGTLGTGFFEKELKLRMYDSNENEISNEDGFLTMDHSTATLYSVLIRERTLAVKPSGTVGTPYAGHRVINVYAKDAIIEVNGIDSNFGDFEEIMIPAEVIDVTGISASTEYVVDITPYLPEGITVDGDGLVTVMVELEAMETMNLSYTGAEFILIEQESGFDYSIPENTNITIRLRGYAEDLANVTSAAFQPVLNVSGLTEGRNRVKVQVTDMPGVTVENADSLVISVTKTAHPVETEPDSSSEGDSSSETDESTEGSSTESTGTEDSTDDTSGSTDHSESESQEST